MAAPRAFWKGYLKPSLVTCPVAMDPASSQSEKTRMHQINRKTGNRLRQQRVDEKTGRVVEGDNKARVASYSGPSLKPDLDPSDCPAEA
jgi:DNA end-binding protein Ku